jgi:hypothetical protein
METEHPLGGGLRVNDMILCINGKVRILSKIVLYSFDFDF